MSRQQCVCPIQKRAEMDEETVCSGCGTVLEEKHVEQNTFSKTDENGNSQRHHEIGLGTDVNETASTDLKRYTKNHVTKTPGNKYVNYVMDRLRFFIKSNSQFQSLNIILEDEVRKEILSFVNGKKKAGEGIEETKIPRKVGNRTENKIRYYSLDSIMEKTIMDFCFKNPRYGININPDTIELHRNPRHHKNGVRPGTKRGRYNKPYQGLRELACTEHGRFNEQSHRQHWIKIHQGMNKENISYPTYQEKYIDGYREWKLKQCELKKSVLRTKKVSNISTCQKCGIRIKLKLSYGYKRLKNGEKRRYSYQREVHVLEMDGIKFESTSCAKARSVFDQFNPDSS